jgi:leader peptidase (prepilin peptidase) / N-methyltransferase
MTLLLVWLALFGLVIGSFLNVCIGRLPAGESIVSPGSRCPSCHASIAWYDNIPIVSYVVLRGRCRTCRVRISARYPFTEALTALAFVLQGLWFHDDVSLLAQRLVLTALLVVLFGTDLETQRLPNVITYPGMAAGLVFSVWVPPGLVACAIGAAVGAGILLGVRWTWKRVTGVDGMGLGDVKMMALLGAFLGWRQIGVVLFLASLSGAVVGVALALTRRRSLQARLPFGTFLAVAAFVASLTGEPLVRWYLGLYASTPPAALSSPMTHDAPQLVRPGDPAVPSFE